MSAEALWRRVDRTDPESCWLTNNAGRYTRVFVDGRFQSAHRVAFELAYGPVPAGQHVCHRCDAPACINPAHLFAGTASDNQQDAIAKGRRRLGATHPQAVLTAEDAAELRALLAAGWAREALAVRFGVSKGTVQRIATNRLWSGR